VGSDVLIFFLVSAFFLVAMVTARSGMRGQIRLTGTRRPAPRAPIVPPMPPPTEWRTPDRAPATVSALPPSPPPTGEEAGALRASREQAVLLRRHFPPRRGALSHWGGVPIAPPGFAWPSFPMAGGYERALTFVLQVDCAAIPERGRLGLMPARGQLYVFLDLDWGRHWKWSVRYADGDPQGFVPARVPASLPRAYPQREYWGWPQRDEDWPYLLPAWSLEPVLLTGEQADPGPQDPDEASERLFWPGTIDVTRALGEIEGAVVPSHYYRNTYDGQGVLVRPYANYPHDWRAVRIVLGRIDQRHTDHYVARGTLTEEQAIAFRHNLQGWLRHWSERASAEDPRAALSQEDSDAVWQFLVAFQPVTLFALNNAVNESIEASLAADPDSARLLPPEALDLVRIRHSLGSTGEHGLHIADTERMLCAPSYVQGDAEERLNEWLLLLEMSSDSPIGHHWAEGVYQFWIRPADLASRRFDRVELTASAY
jgi:hypothetical protein